MIGPNSPPSKSILGGIGGCECTPNIGLMIKIIIVKKTINPNLGVRLINVMGEFQNQRSKTTLRAKDQRNKQREVF